jgi:hypothetical protein
MPCSCAAARGRVPAAWTPRATHPGTRRSPTCRCAWPAWAGATRYARRPSSRAAGRVRRPMATSTCSPRAGRRGMRGWRNS